MESGLPDEFITRSWYYRVYICIHRRGVPTPAHASPGSWVLPVMKTTRGRLKFCFLKTSSCQIHRGSPSVDVILITKTSNHWATLFSASSAKIVRLSLLASRYWTGSGTWDEYSSAILFVPFLPPIPPPPNDGSKRYLVVTILPCVALLLIICIFSPNHCHMLIFISNKWSVSYVILNSWKDFAIAVASFNRKKIVSSTKALLTLSSKAVSYKKSKYLKRIMKKSWQKKIYLN